MPASECEISAEATQLMILDRESTAVIAFTGFSFGKRSTRIDRPSGQHLTASGGADTLSANGPVSRCRRGDGKDVVVVTRGDGLRNYQRSG